MRPCTPLLQTTRPPHPTPMLHPVLRSVGLWCRSLLAPDPALALLTWIRTSVFRFAKDGWSPQGTSLLTAAALDTGSEPGLVKSEAGKL